MKAVGSQESLRSCPSQELAAGLRSLSVERHIEVHRAGRVILKTGSC